VIVVYHFENVSTRHFYQLFTHLQERSLSIMDMNRLLPVYFCVYMNRS